MAKVIVFEKNGDIRLATVIDETKEVCRENLTDFVLCPMQELASVPGDMVVFCIRAAVQYLYRDAEGCWKSTRG